MESERDVIRRMKSASRLEKKDIAEYCKNSLYAELNDRVRTEGFRVVALREREHIPEFGGSGVLRFRVCIPVPRGTKEELDAIGEKLCGLISEVRQVAPMGRTDSHFVFDVIRTYESDEVSQFRRV